MRLNKWSNDQLIRQQSSQVLALLGHSSPPKGAGIRILSIDGGGIYNLSQINIINKFCMDWVQALEEFWSLKYFVNWRK